MKKKKKKNQSVDKNGSNNWFQTLVLIRRSKTEVKDGERGGGQGRQKQQNGGRKNQSEEKWQ